MMKHIRSDWKKFLRYAWSLRLSAIAGLLSGVSAILPLFVDSIPRGVFAGLTLIFVTGAMVAQFIVQKDLP